MMPNAFLYPEPDNQNCRIKAACLVLENENSKQESIATQNDVISELCRVLAYEKQLRYRLVYYALKNIRLYFSSDSMNSLNAQDVVQIVIEKIITGARKWNKSLIPDIKALLFLSIKSFIRNERRRIKNVRLLKFDELDSESDHFSITSFCNQLDTQDFDENIFSSDLGTLIAKLKLLLKDDVYASFVLDEILDGAESNIEIASTLKIPVKDVENAKKRIRNKSNKLINKSG